MKKKSWPKIIFKIVYNLGKLCIFAFLLVFALIICMQGFSDNSISFLNYRLFSVITGSMAPVYEIGDVLLCETVDIEDLKVGDDISYVGDDGTYKNKVITHRIIKIEQDEDGEPLFYTKGIATKTIDPVVRKNQIFGKITKNVAFLSALYKFISKPSGFYIAIFVPLIVLISSEIVISMVEKNSNKKGKKIHDRVDSGTSNDSDDNIKRIEELQKEIKKAQLELEIKKMQKEIDEKKNNK